MNEMPGFLSFLQHADGVAWLVLLVLLGGSVVSWTLIVMRVLRVVRTRRRSESFLQSFWDAPGLDHVARTLGTSHVAEPFAHLLQHGLDAAEKMRRRDHTASLVDVGPPDAMLTRALRRAIDEVRLSLEHGQTFLATVASSAPFVGLLGTVWGIHHALMAIGMSGQSTLDKVAGPVGEALIMTGIGLAVAIPAAVAYNAFARTNRNILARLDSFAYDVHTLLSTGIKGAGPRKVVSLVAGGAR